MLSGEQLQSLYLTLNSKQQTLDKISQKYKASQGSPDIAFRTACSIGQLLLMNLLTKTQRLVGIFLLLEVCLAEGPKDCALCLILFAIFDRSKEPFEKQMIHDVLVLEKRDKFAKTRLELLCKEYELCMQDKHQYTPKFEILRKDVANAMPKVPVTRASEVRRVLEDYPLTSAPEQPLRKEQFHRNQLILEGYSVSFLRPVPNFMPLQASELAWLNPQMIVDVMWDSSYVVRQQLLKAQHTPLTPNQTTHLLTLLPKISPLICQKQDFMSIFSKNPQIALALLDHIPTNRLNDYYEQLVNIELSKASLESMRKLILQRDVPFLTVNYYVIKAMQKCEEIPDKVNQDRLARLIISFIKDLIKNKKLDPKELEAEIKSFGIRFSQVDEVAKLYKRFAENSK